MRGGPSSPVEDTPAGRTVPVYQRRTRRTFEPGAERNLLQQED